MDRLKNPLLLASFAIAAQLGILYLALAPLATKSLPAVLGPTIAMMTSPVTGGEEVVEPIDEPPETICSAELNNTDYLGGLRYDFGCVAFLAQAKAAPLDKPEVPTPAPTVAFSARPSVPSPPRLYPVEVEQWRVLIAAYFAPADVDLAMLVMSCESGGDYLARNPSSDASGLFQHIPRYWAARSANAGIPGADIFDPAANVAVAAHLVYTEGWRHWNASRGCWG